MIFGKDERVSIEWLAAGLQTARRVGRVELNDHAVGTGFLMDGDAIDPLFRGLPVFLTRDFVLARTNPLAVTAKDLRWQHAAVVFQASDGSSAFTRHRFEALVAFAPALHLVALVLESPPQGVKPLAIAPHTPAPGQSVYVLGYPLGGGLQVALRDNECLGVENLHGARQLLYRAATDGGSSGSPVLNEHWEVVAVHLGSDPGRMANFGTPILDLMEGLRSALRTPTDHVTDYSTLRPHTSSIARDGIQGPGPANLEYYSAFLSYSHDDKKFATRLFRELRSLGVAVWWDQIQMRVGDDIYARINEMRKTDKVILCCSESSLKSLWVDSELKLALSKERKLREDNPDVSIVLPLDLDGYLGRWKGSLSAQFVSRNYADFVGWEADDDKFREGVQQVARALEIEKRQEDFPELKLV